MSSPSVNRRRLLQVLAANPLFAQVCAAALAEDRSIPSRLPDPMVWAPRELGNLISDPKEALDVFDFEPVAKKNLPPAHLGYLATDIDDEVGGFADVDRTANPCAPPCAAAR
jgi:4-hydroxymandelate oxidase